MAQALWTNGMEDFNKRDYQPALKKFNSSLDLYREIGDQQSEADLLTWIAAAKLELTAVVNYKSANIVDVLKYLKESQKIYHKLDSSPGEKAVFKDVDKIIKALDIFVEASSYRDAKDYKSALQKYIDVLHIAKEIGNKRYEAGMMLQIGYTYHRLNDLSKTLDYYKRALALHQEIGSHVAEVTANKLLGDSLMQYGYLNMSLGFYKQAITIVQETGNSYREGSILHTVGQLLNNMGHYTEALKAYNKAMQIFKEVHETISQGEVFVDIGETNINLGNYLEAIDNLQIAFKIFEESGDNIEKQKTLNALSKAYELLGAKEKAVGYDLKSQEITLVDEKTKSGQWLFFSKKGLSLSKENKFDVAMDNLQRALAVSKKMGDKIKEVISLNFIGMLYQQLKEYPKALEVHREALKISIEQKHKRGEFNTLLDIASFYYFQSDFLNSLDYSLKALEISKEIGSKPLEIDCLRKIGFTYSDLKQYSKAEEYFKKALLLAEEMESPEKIWKLQQGVGFMAWFSDDLQKTKKYFAEAINTVEAIRDKIKADEYKTSFVNNKLAVYRNMIHILLLLNEYEESFNYVERAKSRSLLDLLGNRLKLETGKDKELNQEEKKLQEKIGELLEKIHEEQSQPKEKQRAVLTILNKELGKLKKEYAELLIKIKRENPELSSLVSVNPLKLKEVQKLLDLDTTLLEYFVTPNKTLLWIVDKSDLNVLEINIKSEELGLKINGYRKKITTPQPDYKNEAKELYNLLIEPARPYIKTKRIGIVPHSILHYLPFQALIDTDDKPRFLIEEYEIFYTPSASVLKFVYEKRKKVTGKILAFGNPDLGDKKYDLPYAEEEVKKIKDIYPDTALFMKNKATKEKVKKLSGDYNIIHFASHGELNSENPLFSSIRLAKDKHEDGRLEVHEIFNLNLKNTSLVTLSACETGLGKLTQGDELIGMTRGFIYAGTPSIVASLWSVNDRSTSELMGMFYKNLKNHSKAEALRMAQIEMIRGEVGKGIVRGVGGITTSKEAKSRPQPSMTVDGSHPYFWAPFILLGDWK